MICGYCRNAGRYKTQARAIDEGKDLPDKVTSKMLLEWAVEEHSKCPGGTRCDCLHRV